ncbi:MAG: ornithine carbamoyltransferase [Chitinispirillia bacterium]|nr:ornithine carbamoyltransferase [Chitinispirillia bacterium]MCL2268799.1 ornithine carbamoyltransferase [Chitinispirillia bacterium]
MKKKDLLTLFDYSPDEIRGILALAAKLKEGRGVSEKKVLTGKTGVMIFEKPSLRTRISFETAICELGGHPINLASESVGMGKRESVEDVARNLERIVHLVIARTFAHETLTRLAASCSVPVINALTDTSHPCQALAFGLTMQEERGGKRINVAFAGDGNNVCFSIMALCAKLGHKMTVASPRGYEPGKEVIAKCKEVCAATGGSIVITNDLRAAVADADAIYTDVWASMGQEEEAEERKKVFAGYQINADIVALAPKDVLVSHCLPAHRGEEITDDVLDSDASVAYDEAENRLHVQKAVITHLFS